MNFGLERIGPSAVASPHPGNPRGAATRRQGSKATPGEFRRPRTGSDPRGFAQAGDLRPTSGPEMKKALHDFEGFLHADSSYPTLIEVGLAHAQFETIHPFLDGNGRVGRLLNTFLLVHRGVLRQPLLYLSYFFKLHRTEYYDRLMAVRLAGDWEGWIRSSCAVSPDGAGSDRDGRATFRAARIASQPGPGEQPGPERPVASLNLFQRPLVTSISSPRSLGSTFPTASRLVSAFEELDC